MLSIVLSDDNVLVLNKLNMMISEYKEYIVLGCAMNGSRTIELVNSKKPDLLIMDIEMPKPNGIEIAQYIEKNGLSTAMLALSNYNDYEYVRQVMRAGAIDYLLKHELNSDLPKKKLDEACAIIQQRHNEATKKKYFSLYAKQNFLFSLLNGNVENIDESHLIAEEREFSGASHVIVCIQIINFIDFFSSEDRIAQNVINICNGIFFETGNGLCTYLQNGMFVILLRTNEAMGQAKIQSEVLKTIKLIQSNLARILNLDIIYSYEMFWGGIENIHTYYKLAVERLNNTHQHGSIKKNDYVSEQYSIGFDDERILINALYRADIEEITRTVKKILEDSTCYGINGVLSATYEFCSLGEKYLKHLGVDYQTELESMPKIKSMSTVAECESYFISFFTRIVQYNCKKDSYKTLSPHIKKALEYIHQNYGDDISLSVVSDKLHLSTVYFSHLFKAETGSTFTDYLTGYRIRMAKEMLRNTSYSLKEIAKKTGFRDYNYFIQVFREIVGKTPISFRNSLSDAQES